MNKRTPSQAARQIATELGQSSPKGTAMLAVALKEQNVSKPFRAFEYPIEASTHCGDAVLLHDGRIFAEIGDDDDNHDTETAHARAEKGGE